MIKPTVGRKVWYRPADHETAMAVQKDIDGVKQPLDATIVCVHSDHCVNLVIFDANGIMQNRNSAYLRQDGVDLPVWVTSYAEWMPYQVGQAKKHEPETEKQG